MMSGICRLTKASARRIQAELRSDPARPDLTIAAKLDLKPRLIALVRFQLEAITDPETRLHSYRRGVHASFDCWCRFTPGFTPPVEVQEPPAPPETPTRAAVTLPPTPRPAPKPQPNPRPVNPRKLDADDDWIIVSDWPERPPPATAEQLQAHFSNRERQRASVARTRR